MRRAYSCYHAIMQVVGASGQIKTAQVIPDDELWLHTPEMKAGLDRALEWSHSHARSETDLDALAKKVRKL